MQNKDEALGTQPIGKLMLSLALPAVAAQFINMLYNIVDRIYIGNIPGTGALALTGVGVTFPIILLVSAFAAFAGMGGAPLASIQLGAGNREGAEKILGNCFSMLLVLSVTLTVIFSIFKTPLLYMFGASDAIIGYAEDYISIYLAGTIFVQLALGLNTFISAQGHGIAPFIMQSTESLVNITLNAGLQRYGGDLYVGSMTIMQSVMQMLVMPIQGITQGAQPIMSYNYGAKNYSRVRKTFSLLLKVMLLVTVSGFALAALLPGVLARMFTQDAELIEIVKKMMPIFFGGIWAFGAQMACQTTFMALGQAKISLFLALLRKVVLLVPLALLLPVVMGGNVLGIYIAEPVADVIASFTTLSLFLIKRKTLLPDGGAPAKSK